MTTDTIVGKEFYFDGDWQTFPGRWRVVGELNFAGMYPCEPADRENFKGVSFWWASVVENCIKRGGGAG